MSCLLVPAAEAVITTIASRILEKRAQKKEAAGEVSLETPAHEPFYKKLKVLSDMLWGGSVLLAIDHVWNGEAIIPTTAEALNEMATLGVSMAALLTAAWAAIVAAKSLSARRKFHAETVKSSENS